MCEDCRKDDWECINRNRVRHGYLKFDKEELDRLGVADIVMVHSPEL